MHDNCLIEETFSFVKQVKYQRKPLLLEVLINF